MLVNEKVVNRERLRVAEQRQQSGRVTPMEGPRTTEVNETWAGGYMTGVYDTLAWILSPSTTGAPAKYIREVLGYTYGGDA